MPLLHPRDPPRTPEDTWEQKLQSILTWAELIAIEKKSDNGVTAQTGSDDKVEVFQSVEIPSSITLGKAVFGGYVLAQSTNAASKTVPEPFVLHDVSGYWTRAGRVSVPFVYTVRYVRDGGRYSIRAVDARQESEICFTAICSFKRPEKYGAEHYQNHQPPAPLMKDNNNYDSVLLNPKTGKLRSPVEFCLAPGADAPWYIRAVESGEIEEPEFPGTEVRKVDMTLYNETDEVKANPHKYRQLQWYRIKDSVGEKKCGSPQKHNTAIFSNQSLEAGEYDNLFACAHLYASDKNSLFIIPRAIGEPDGWQSVASLSIHVIFHKHGESIRMLKSDDEDATGRNLKNKWFLQESSTSRSGENRGLFEQRIWTEDGTLLATVMQDAIIEYKKPPGAKL